jgi:hypothetical protein
MERGTKSDAAAAQVPSGVNDKGASPKAGTVPFRIRAVSASGAEDKNGLGRSCKAVAIASATPTARRMRAFPRWGFSWLNEGQSAATSTGIDRSSKPISVKNPLCVDPPKSMAAASITAQRRNIILLEPGAKTCLRARRLTWHQQDHARSRTAGEE